MQQLRTALQALDGQGYKAYKSIAGKYAFGDYVLSIDHVQGDPFALPSRISLQVDTQTAQIPPDLCSNPIRRLALTDFLARALAKAIRRYVRGDRGSGHSGEISMAPLGQQVLQRNAVLLIDEGRTAVEARLTLGLPALNRRAAGQEAITMLFDELPQVVRHGLCFTELDQQSARVHVDSVEDQTSLRDWLATQKLAAFIADGALLPRASGVNDQPLLENAILFEAPDTLARTVTLPHAGTIRGLAIPRGVTLIVGGGFHGKSTLLHALERGVYNHFPGDGRERVVTDASAVKIRAEDGRRIACLDISPFINHLPFGEDTAQFSTLNASGSTSQTANIIEAIHAGAKVLLIDEDTSATNFMIRDQRMQALVSTEREPITPFLQRVRELYTVHGISTILVMGGSGDYFAVADTVIMMDHYRPQDVTARARQLAGDAPDTKPPALKPFQTGSSRRPGAEVLDPARGHRAVKIDTPDVRLLRYGAHDIDLRLIEQLIDIGQTRCIGLLLHCYSRHYLDRDLPLMNGLCQMMADAEQRGLDSVSPYKVGNLALPRLYELAAAINRIREGRWQ